MTISKARKEKRRAVHYKAMCVAAVLEGLHPSWLPKNDQGNLLHARHALEYMLSTLKHNPTSAMYYSLPRGSV
jgi:hypothetical protein